jgi:uncharacterized protein
MLGVVLAVAAALAASTSPPAPSRWVEDHAGLLSPATRSALDARLEAYEHATGHQVVVWIDKTLGGAPLDDWAVRTFAAWKIGRAGFDDGIAVFVFADDRRIDIEVGYGLDAKLPDATASRIIREVMALVCARGRPTQRSQRVQTQSSLPSKAMPGRRPGARVRPTARRLRPGSWVVSWRWRC